MRDEGCMGQVIALCFDCDVVIQFYTFVKTHTTVHRKKCDC